MKVGVNARKYGPFRSTVNGLRLAYRGYVSGMAAGSAWLASFLVRRHKSTLPFEPGDPYRESDLRELGELRKIKNLEGWQQDRVKLLTNGEKFDCQRLPEEPCARPKPRAA